MELCISYAKCSLLFPLKNEHLNIWRSVFWEEIFWSLWVIRKKVYTREKTKQKLKKMLLKILYKIWKSKMTLHTLFKLKAFESEFVQICSVFFCNNYYHSIIFFIGYTHFVKNEFISIQPKKPQFRDISEIIAAIFGVKKWHFCLMFALFNTNNKEISGSRILTTERTLWLFLKFQNV